MAVSLGSYRVSLGWCVVCFSLRKYRKGRKSTYYGLHTPGWRDNDFIIHWCRLLSKELNVSLAIYISINVEYCLHVCARHPRPPSADACENIRFEIKGGPGNVRHLNLIHLARLSSHVLHLKRWKRFPFRRSMVTGRMSLFTARSVLSVSYQFA